MYTSSDEVCKFSYMLNAEKKDAVSFEVITRLSFRLAYCYWTKTFKVFVKVDIKEY
jgi:hypothetical protein